MIAVVGAGAMGAALAFLHERAGHPTALLGTALDDATIETLRSGNAHPALGVSLPAEIDIRPHRAWAAVLRDADRIVLGISSDGLAQVVEDIAGGASREAMWVVATKGWDRATLRTPSEIVGAVSDRVVLLAGPALAPELVAGAPTAMVCASSDLDLARDVAGSLGRAGVSAEITDDVVGAEIGAAYKNVTAIAVGMCEGLTERLPESVFVHRHANARAAVFAQGLKDMSVLAAKLGGRAESIYGLAGAGDLYVTCLGGRNGNFGRLLGAGQTPDQALKTIGSTVEGVANTAASLALAEKVGVEIHAARAVEAVLAEKMAPDEAITALLRSVTNGRTG
jgi:glycerol-3-phosphate dehydrogenase (NAD(P)+)